MGPTPTYTMTKTPHGTSNSSTSRKRRETLRSATLADVAREAGVSIATASRVLSPGDRQVADQYRIKVMQAADRLNYAANLAAQATARGLAATVTLLVPDITDPYFSSIAAGVSRAAEEASLLTTMALTHRDPLREVQLVQAVRGQRPQVLVLAGSRHISDKSAGQLDDELRAYADIGGKPVFLSQATSTYPTIDFDNFGAARAMARTIAELGYRHALLLAGPRDLVVSRERVRGMKAGSRDRGLGVDKSRVLHCPLSRDGGYEAITSLDDETLRRADVVMAISDVVAIGAMTALRDRGLRVPEDIAVSGFDDVPAARDTHPPLSSVQLPLEDAGYAAVQAALRPSTVSIVMGGSVVVRESTPAR